LAHIVSSHHFSLTWTLTNEHYDIVTVRLHSHAAIE